jgi:Ca2+-binding EF-hand superfamily protein
MPRFTRCLLLALLAAAPAAAQVPLDHAARADLDTLRARAAALGDAADILRQLDRLNRDRGGDLAQRLRELLGAQPSGTGSIFYRDAALVALATERAQLLATVLSADLDNDGTVTREEITRTLQFGRPNATLGNLFLRFDADSDDRITAAELALGVEAMAEPATSGRQDRALAIGRLIDFDDNGQITPEELDRAVAALIAQDAPLEFGTSTIDPATGTLPSAERAACAVTPPSEGALIHLVTAYEGQALTTVSIGGQDRVTQTAELVIEPGETPLYLVVGSFNLVIWRVTGAVDRVERIVVQSGSGAGDLRSGAVTGLPAEKVTFVASGACFRPGWEEAEGLTAAATLAPHLGRPADAAFAVYAIGSVALPSRTAVDAAADTLDDGQAPNPSAQADTRDPPASPGQDTAPIREELLRFHPGGVIAIDPGAVISAHPVEPYAVLPQAAGLIQLMEQGLIQRLDRVFVIQRPIPRFPAGLNGAHSVNFALAPGVPLPPGDLGHSSLRDADGACLAGMCP